MTMSLRGGERQCRHYLMQMSEEDIAKLTLPELIELIQRLLDEIEIRAMELS